MKKFLSIKNSQGIYVARASFSSDETVIDFVNNKNSDDCNSKPVSIGITPDQQVATSIKNYPITAIESAYDSISVPSESLIVASKSSKKKRLSKVLQLLHLKRKSKMSDQSKDDDDRGDAYTKKAIEMPSTSSSLPVLPAVTPKLSRSKGRTAALVKKFSLTPKKSPPKELKSTKKSSLPLRASSEAIPNAPQLAFQNRIETTTSVSHHSRSEMNLVNIDYRQESSGDNLDVGVNVGQTQYRTIRSSNQSGNTTAAGGDNEHSKLTRALNASSNLSIRSGPWPPNANSSGKANAVGRKSSSTEKLQITISGKKRVSTADSVSELLQRKQPLHETEPKRIERKALTMQQSPKKFNINHDLTLMNTVGVPPAPTTQAPSAIPSSIRATTATATAMATAAAPTTTATSIKNVVQSSLVIKAQSTMQSQQSVDASASATDVEQSNQRVPSLTKSKTQLITVTSFDVDEPDDIAAANKNPDHEKDTSLLTEIIEAERRNSLSMDLLERGRRYPGVAASENIKFQPANTSDSAASTSAIATNRKQSQPEIIPKVIIEEYPSLSNEKIVDKREIIENQFTTIDAGDTNTDTTGKDTDNKLLNTLTQSSGAKQFQQPNEEADNNDDTTTSHPTLQFEVGKQVRPIFPSNQNLHHNTYSALDNDPATAYTSILTSTSSYIDTHNIDRFEPKSAPVVNVYDKDNDNGGGGHGTNQTRSHLQISRGRRRIAYMDSSSKSNDSLSTSNSTINTEDEVDIHAENRLDSSTLSQFSNLHTSSTFITDFVMPPYGDLVWDNDGVIARIRNCHFLLIFVSDLVCFYLQNELFIG